MDMIYIFKQRDIRKEIRKLYPKLDIEISGTGKEIVLTSNQSLSDKQISNILKALNNRWISTNESKFDLEDIEKEHNKLRKHRLYIEEYKKDKDMKKLRKLLGVEE